MSLYKHVPIRVLLYKHAESTHYVLCLMLTYHRKRNNCSFKCG